MKIVIVGAGGHGRVVLDIFRSNHQFEVAGFLDSNLQLHHQAIDGVEVLGDLSLLERLPELGIGGAIVAIGDNRIRQLYAETIENAGISLINAIHPSATVADSARVGKNVVIAAGAHVCTHVVIEDSVILNTACIVDHQSHIATAAHICPGVRLAGHVRVDPAAFVGIGATIVQNITIGEAAVVGAGAVVINDVPAYNTVVGVPARIVKTSRLASAHMEQNAHAPDWNPARNTPARPKRIRPPHQTAHQPALQP